MAAFLVIGIAGAGSSEVAGVSEREESRLGKRQDGWVVDAHRVAATPNRPRSETRRCPDHHAGVRWYRQRHRHWQQKRGARVSSQILGRAPRSCPDARYLAGVWRTRARIARKAAERYMLRLRQARAARFRALYEKWECIHEHEGAWNSNTGNGYYGGLQMDISFQLAHGRRFYERWGTANRWPVWAQLAAAEDAYRTRGFGPWPNTARMCGLR